VDGTSVLLARSLPDVRVLTLLCSLGSRLVRANVANGLKHLPRCQHCFILLYNFAAQELVHLLGFHICCSEAPLLTEQTGTRVEKEDSISCRQITERAAGTYNVQHR
jgi:hypothetical protein